MYLSAELNEVLDIFQKCQIDFLNVASKEKRGPPKLSLSQAAKALSENLDQAIEVKEKDVNPECFKRLYRKIMIKVHPDKLVQIESEDIKEMYSNVCAKAMKAVEDKSWYLLFGAAKDVGIEYLDITQENIDLLKDDCDKISSEISRIKTTLPWVWFHGEDNIKESCLKQYSKI